MVVIDYIAWILVLVGALNWGLVGAFKVNLVDKLFEEDSSTSRTIYVAVGLAAIYVLIAWLARLSQK